MLLLVLAGSISLDASLSAKNPAFLHSEIHCCSPCMAGDLNLGNGQSPCENQPCYHRLVTERKLVALGMAELAK